MSDIITKQSEIPDAWGYVLAVDTFMSGWGPSEGKRNVCVFPVTREQASDVEMACHERTEFNRVRLVRNKPRILAHNLYSLFDDSASAFYGDKAGANRESN